MKIGALLLVVAACGGRTDLGGHVQQDASTAPTPLQGVVVNECAPNDGLEVDYDLVISGAPVPTCKSPVVSQGGFRIAFWGPPPTVPGDYTIGDGSFPSGSFALYCPGSPDQCVTALHGTFKLTEYTQTSASGSFTLVLPDQTTISGTFVNTPVCANSIMCG